METRWKEALEAGKTVSVKIEPVYSGVSQRPVSFTIRYKIGDNDWGYSKNTKSIKRLMMPTKKIEELYQKISDKLYSIIPDKWNKLYLYAEILNDSRCVYFDFESSTKNKYIYSHNIPFEYDVDDNIYIELLGELMECFEQLHEEFKLSTPEVWTNLTMYLDITGKFSMDYNYDEINLAPDQQRTIWKYKVLGIYPTDKDDISLVDEYVKDSENKDK